MSLSWQGPPFAPLILLRGILLFVLDGNGHATTTFTVPSTLSGNLFAMIQGAVGDQPCGTVPYVLTACFRLQ